MSASAELKKQPKNANPPAAGPEPGSSRLFQESVDCLVQGITIFDADLRLVLANKAFLELRDIPEELGRPGTSFERQVRFRAERGDYGPGDVEEIVRRHMALARRFEPHTIERVQPDGTTLKIRGNPIPGGGFIAIYTDITESKHAEEELRDAKARAEQAHLAGQRAARRELRESEDRLHTIIENLIDGLVVIDQTGVIESFNHAACEMFGYAADEVVGRNVSMLMPRGDAGRHDGYLDAFLRTGDGKIIGIGPREVVASRKDGSTFEMDLAISEMSWDDRPRFIGVVRDITERKRIARRLERDATIADLLHCVSVAVSDAEAPSDALRVSLPQICAIGGWQVGHVYFSGADDDETLKTTGIWYLRDAARFASFQRSSETMQFRPGDGLVGGALRSGMPEWVEDVTARPEYQRREAAAEAGLKGAYFVPICVGHSAVAVLELYSTELVSADPDFTNFMHQVSNQFGRAFERWLSHNDLRAAKEQAEAANRAKSEFLANMSHELRTPLNGVLGLGAVLESTELSDDQRGYVEMIRQSGESLLAMIVEILDFTKLESGHLEIEPAAFGLSALIESVGEEMRSLATAKGLDAMVDASAALPDIVEGDGPRIRQVLLTLIGNAVKFTEAGSVTLRVAPARMDPTTAWVCFEVIDTGVGLPAEHHARIFDRFTQVDESETRKYGGAGMGLAIAKLLCMAMGGEIDVDSEPGAGSRFRFTLPLGGPKAGDAG